MIAPMMSWATVPTTISERAVAMRSQIDNNVATRANPSHKVARNQVSVMVLSFHRSGRFSRAPCPRFRRP